MHAPSVVMWTRFTVRLPSMNAILSGCSQRLSSINTQKAATAFGYKLNASARQGTDPKSRQVETLLCELSPSSEDLVNLVVFAGNSLAGDAGETPVTC